MHHLVTGSGMFNLAECFVGQCCAFRLGAAWAGISNIGHAKYSTLTLLGISGNATKQTGQTSVGQTLDDMTYLDPSYPCLYILALPKAQPKPVTLFIM